MMTLWTSANIPHNDSQFTIPSGRMENSDVNLYSNSNLMSRYCMDIDKILPEIHK